MRYLVYWCILTVKFTIQLSRRLSQKWHLLTKTGARCYHIILQIHTSTGATPPPSLSMQHKRRAFRGSQNFINGNPDEGQVCLNLSALQPYIMDNCT